jgi:hypothetical protein
MARIAQTPNQVAEAILENLNKRQQLLFPVEMVETSSITGGMITPSDSAYAVVGTIKGQKRLLQTCSKGYNLKKNAEIFPVIEDMLDKAGISYQAKYRHIGYAKFYVDYILTDTASHVGMEVDKIYPMISCTTSYNGKVPCTMSLGLHRLICSNGLTMPVFDRNQFNQTVKHVDKLEIVFANWMEHIKRYIKEFKMKDNILLNNLNILANSPVMDIETRIEEVRNAVKFPAKTIDLAIEIATRETDMLGYQKSNDWLVYNGMNEALYSNLSDKHPEFKAEIDANVFDFILNDAMSKIQ